MADLNYDIGVNTKEAVNAVNTLKNALGLLAGAFTVREIVQFADGITNLRNKLMTLTPDIATVNKQFNALAAIAMEARTPLNDTADLFYKIQRSAKALGISQQEAADITSSVAKALTASGMSAQQASGPLLQLGQALQSGVFQGDELRSILEGLGPVAQAIANELGVTVGELKKLGSDGQISADVFVRAMKKAKDSIDEAFGRTTPTIAQALTTLKTGAQLAFNEFEQNTKTGQNFALAIEYMAFQMYKLSKSIDDIIGPLKIVVEVGLALAAFTLAGRIFAAFSAAVRVVFVAVTGLGATFWRVIEAFKDFGSYMAMGGSKLQNFGGAVLMLIAPLKTLAEAIVSVGAAIYTWTGIEWVVEKIKGLGDKSSDTRKELEDFRAELKKNAQTLDEVAPASENAAAAAKKLQEAMAKVRLEMTQQVKGLDEGLKSTRERLAFENEILSANKERTNISEGEAEIGRMLIGLDADRETAVRNINEQIAKMNLQYSQMKVKTSEAAKELAGQIGILKEQKKLTEGVYDQHRRGMVDLTQSNQNLKVITEARKRDEEIIIKSIEDQISRQQALGDIIRGVHQKIADERNATPAGQIVGLNSLQKDIIKIQDQGRKAAQEAMRSFSAQFGGEDGMTPERAQEMSDGLDQIKQAYTRLTEEQIKFAEENSRVARDWNTGWKDAFAEYKDNAFNAAQNAKTYFDTFARSFEDVVVKLVTGTKINFRDLANSIIAEFARIEARKMFAYLFGAGTGGGGILGSLFGFKAGGGPVQAGKPYMVGESGPELFMPNAAGKIVPNYALGGGGQPVTVNYNIQAVDASSFRSLVARDPGFIYAVTEQGRRSQATRRA